MGFILFIRVSDIFQVFPVAEVPGERSQRHTVDMGFRLPITALQIYCKQIAFLVLESDVGIEILFFGQFYLQPVSVGKIQYFREDIKLQYLGNKLGVGGNCIYGFVNVDEAFHRPTAVRTADSWSEIGDGFPQ